MVGDAAPPLGGSAPADGDSSKCLAIMYHYVRAEHDVLAGAECRDFPDHRAYANRNSGVQGITPESFADQVDELCRTLEPIDWPTLFAWREGRRRIPSRSFLLTFDDGLRDHVDAVLPILEHRGLRAVFFVPGAVLTHEQMLPAHATHLLLSALGDDRFAEELHSALDTIGADPQWRSYWQQAEKLSAVTYHYETPQRGRLKYFLNMLLPQALRDRVLEELFERHIGAPKRWAREWYLGWDDLARMQQSGHTIGGHGFAHEPLARMNPGAAAANIRRIARILRDGLGADPRPFSYPLGSFNDAVTRMCCDAGFAHAFTTEQSWINSGADNMRLPRVDTINVLTHVREERACR